MLLLKSIILFITAGFCEIGGGYLIWIWLREGKSSWFALAGAIILILYGIVPTFQPAHFGRVYAAYGGIFVVSSIFWGWKNPKGPLMPAGCPPGGGDGVNKHSRSDTSDGPDS